MDKGLLKLMPILSKNICSRRQYALCCPKPTPTCGEPSVSRRVPGPACIQPIAYNPCSPSFHGGHESYLKYKYIFFFICLPLILCQMIRMSTGYVEHEDKEPCREYEYMRRRTKRFPWGNGQESFFHNEHFNHLPSECAPPPTDYCE